MKLHSDKSTQLRILGYQGGELRLEDPQSGPKTVAVKGRIVALDTNGLLSISEQAEQEQASDLTHFLLRLSNMASAAPEVVLIGTGASLHFYPPHIMAPLVQAQIGFEQMDNQAACRTYNILSQEGRKVVLILMPEQV